MLLNINDFVNKNIFEIKVNKRTILLNTLELTNNIEYILFFQLNMKYSLTFYDIYEKLILSLSLTPNCIVEYTEHKIKIYTN